MTQFGLRRWWARGWRAPQGLPRGARASVSREVRCGAGFCTQVPRLGTRLGTARPRGGCNAAGGGYVEYRGRECTEGVFFDADVTRCCSKNVIAKDVSVTGLWVTRCVPPTWPTRPVAARCRLSRRDRVRRLRLGPHRNSQATSACGVPARQGGGTTVTIVASSDNRSCALVRQPPSITGAAAPCLHAGGRVDAADGLLVAALGRACLVSDTPNDGSVGAVWLGDPAVAATVTRNELLSAGAPAAATTGPGRIDGARRRHGG